MKLGLTEVSQNAFIARPNIEISAISTSNRIAFHATLLRRARLLLLETAAGCSASRWLCFSLACWFFNSIWAISALARIICAQAESITGTEAIAATIIGVISFIFVCWGNRPRELNGDGARGQSS